jgi:hypothetical protein
VRDRTKADIKRKKVLLLIESHSTLVLTHIAIAAVCNKLPLFQDAMCIKVRHIETRYATEDYKANLEDRMKVETKMK